MIQNTHPQKGLDYHFRALGFEERQNLSLIAADNRRFDNGIIVSKPDWVVDNTRKHVVTVIEYKSRVLGSGSPNPYEVHEALIHACVVEDELSVERGRPVSVTCALLYGDGPILALDRTDGYKYDLYNRAIEAPTDLFFLGVSSRVRHRVNASDLARLLVDPEFTDPYFDNSSASAKGIIAHEQTRCLGPNIEILQ